MTSEEFDVDKCMQEYWSNPVHRFVFYWLGRLDGDYDDMNNEEFMKFLREKCL